MASAAALHVWEPAPDLAAALGRLAAKPAVLPLTAVPRVLGLDRAEAAAILAALLEQELVEVWEHPTNQRGPALVLSSRAATLLGLTFHTPDRYVSSYPKDLRRYRWAARDREPQPRAELTLFHEPEFLELVADPGAMAHELPEPPAGQVSGAGLTGAGLVYLGLGICGWCPALESGDPCRICGNRRLRRTEICLGCGSSGWAQREGFQSACDPPPPRIRQAADDRLGGGTGRHGPTAPPKVEDEPGTGRPRWAMPWARRNGTMTRRGGRKP